MTDKVRRFQIKLNPGANPDKILKIPGVIDVFTAFPEELSDLDLALIYFVDAAPEQSSDVFTSLSVHSDVEYAEIPAKRKLS